MLNGNGTAPKVVVVGGSLGGLFNAIALRFLGCEVEVFEKSSGLMKDRGAGIVFQQEVAEFLTRYEVAPLESVVVPVRTRRYLGHDGAGIRRLRRLAGRGPGTPSPRPRRRVHRAVHVLSSPAHAHPLLPDPRPGWFSHAGAAAAQLGVVLERRPRRRTRPGADRQGR